MGRIFAGPFPELTDGWPGFSTLFLEALAVERISPCFRFLKPINHGGCPRFGLGTWVLGLSCLIQSATSRNREIGDRRDVPTDHGAQAKTL